VLSHGPSQVDIKELSENRVTIFAILEAETSVAVSPQGFIPHKNVINRDIFRDLLADIVSRIWDTNRSRQVLFQHKL
jgi:hypothetical protein